MHLQLFGGSAELGLAVYLAVIAIALIVVWLAIKREKAGVGSFLAAPILYAIIAIAAAKFCSRNGFHMLALLAWGCFGGGMLGLVMAAWYARKNNLKVLCQFFIFCALVLGTIGIDAFWVEPHWLEVRHEHITSPKLKEPLTIGILSDLQTDDVGEYESQVVARLVEKSPDMILLPGDYIQENPPKRWDDMKKLGKLFSKWNLRAPLGTYAVRGNTEDDSWPSIFEHLPITTFPTSGSAQAREDIAIYGLSLEDSFNRNLSLKIADPNKFNIVFGHGPDFSLADVPADLLVAGHTHGGQVQIPGKGPLVIISKISFEHGAGGLFDLSGGRKFLLTRGAGMERFDAPRLRFFCRPEIVFVHLSPPRPERKRSKRLGCVMPISSTLPCP